ncbi:MAG TPA: FtsX-like permease family protein [Chryseolinea sp.]
MIKNYLTIALRNFLKNKGYTLINILGLSLGLTACIVIFLVITYDISFDRFHSKYDRIYRVVQEVKSPSGTGYGTVTPYPLAKAFRNDFPEVPLVTQMHYQGEALLTIETEKQRVNDILFADSLFFEVFDFEVLSGNPRVALGEPGKVFLTKSTADKILKNKETTHIKIDKVDLEVVGIIADPPPTSHISFTMIASMASFTPDFIGGFPLDRWGLTARGYTYIVLPEQVTAQSIESRFAAFGKKYRNAEDASRTVQKLQPLREIHFDEQYTDNPGHNENIDAREFVVMGVLGIFILVIACINFINLATALSEKKSKEIGIRKTLGAQRSQLTVYFLSETFLLTTFAVLLSLGATEWLLTWLNPFLKKEIDLPLFSNPVLIFFLVGLIISTTLFAGFYPAVVLSRFNPTAVFRSSYSVPGSSGAFVRKSLVVFQFLIAHILIIGTFIIADQMRYFRSKPLGFDENAIITISLPERTKAVTSALRTRLEQIPGVTNVTFGVGAPISDNGMYTGFFLTESGRAEGAYPTNFKTVDRHYLETYNIKLAAGRWFNEADEMGAAIDIPEGERKIVYIVNKAAARKLGIDPDDMIGRHITTGMGDVDAEVVGVVEDFHVSSLHTEIAPVVFAIFPDYYYEGGVKLKTDNLSETLALVETNWKDVFQDSFFEYEFLDQHLASLYERDEKTFALFKVFAGVSIFIGCLGLYGLISFVANQKRKEVGIRKVMGATISSILILFSKEFVRLVIIAFVIATPLTWYLMTQWLQGFAYKVEISWPIFFVGFIAILFVVLATIAYRSLMAAKANPALTLRSE